jgi:hypothetical protein
MGFDSWFVLATGILGIFTGYAIFTLKRFDIAFWLFVFWFLLVLLEYKLQEWEEEEWKRSMFQ